MRPNDIKPAAGSRPSGKRLGRGIGSGLGKTGGRGHKGQKARSGGFHKTGFEGGQMPLQRRLPKVGFASRRSRFVAELRLHELERVVDGVVTLDSLKQVGLVPAQTLKAKIICSGKIEKAVTVRGVGVTPGARAAIEQAGGKVEG